MVLLVEGRAKSTGSLTLRLSVCQKGVCMAKCQSLILDPSPLRTVNHHFCRFPLRNPIEKNHGGPTQMMVLVVEGTFFMTISSHKTPPTRQFGFAYPARPRGSAECQRGFWYSRALRTHVALTTRTILFVGFHCKSLYGIYK